MNFKKICFELFKAFLTFVMFVTYQGSRNLLQLVAGIFLPATSISGSAPPWVSCNRCPASLE